jgi:hypothetical protein
MFICLLNDIDNVFFIANICLNSNTIQLNQLFLVLRLDSYPQLLWIEHQPHEKASQRAFPIPLAAPVTTTLLFFTSINLSR